MNRHVEMDSSRKSDSGLSVAMNTDLQLPPRLPRSTDVSIELRYGMWNPLATLLRLVRSDRIT